MTSVQETTAMAGCPFCGKPPTYAPLNPQRDGDAWSEFSCTNVDCDATVEVRVHADRGHKEAAIEAWNRRAAAAPPPATSSAMEALREAIEFAEQDYHALTPAGEEMVDRWRAALQAGTEVAVKNGGGDGE